MRRGLRPGLVVAVAVVLAGGGAAFVAWPRDPVVLVPRSAGELVTRLDEVVPTAMRENHVPGASLAVVHDGRVVATRAYGSVNEQTVFQVGSVSKPVAALSVPGYLGLDPQLRLASTLEEVLGRGEAPALRRDGEPGASLRYSGGGYTAAQLWAEQSTGRPVSTLMDEYVLRPLGMRSSTFSQTGVPRGAATGHDAAGRPVPSYRYTAQTAAGLWSTAADIGRFVAFASSDDPVAKSMRTAAPGSDGHWGMGLELQSLRDGGTLMEHEGVNRGWHAQIVAEPKRGWGLAVLTNADGGGAVVDAAVGELIG